MSGMSTEIYPAMDSLTLTNISIGKPVTIPQILHSSYRKVKCIKQTRWMQESGKTDECKQR